MDISDALSERDKVKFTVHTKVCNNAKKYKAGQHKDLALQFFYEQILIWFLSHICKQLNKRRWKMEEWVTKQNKYILYINKVLRNVYYDIRFSVILTYSHIAQPYATCTLHLIQAVLVALDIMQLIFSNDKRPFRIGCLTDHNVLAWFFRAPFPTSSRMSSLWWDNMKSSSGCMTPLWRMRNMLALL